MSVYTVFLDRDGVFDVHKIPGVVKVDDFDWLPGVKEAFAKLNRPDVQTCLCTNQPMVGHFMATPSMIRRVNAYLVDGLHSAGGRMDNVEAAYSPVWFPHRRRKPRPGMLIDGAKKLPHAVDKRRAVMIGDTLKDAKAAAAFGCQAILLRTTHADIESKAEVAGVSAIIVDDLPAAIEWILCQID